MHSKDNNQKITTNFTLLFLTIVMMFSCCRGPKSSYAKGKKSGTELMVNSHS